ncbi:MAG: RNA methyltransferase [Bacillota bacterium]|nr:RNA methyltransferase [Bacillota bacterium]
MGIKSGRQALQFARNLKKRRAREAKQRFLMEGMNFVEDALRKRMNLDFILYTEKILQRERGKRILQQASLHGVSLFLVNEREFKAIAETESPQGILAVGVKPDWQEENLLRRPEGLYLALDGIQDPGNLGTILRTGDGVGVSAVYLGRGTVDLYNPKVLRATMGSIFRVPVFSQVDLAERLAKMRSRRVFVVASDPRDGITYFQANLKHPRLALVIGNEARGVRPELQALADEIVTIPLRPGVESLNAAVATALILYEIYRQNTV